MDSACVGTGLCFGAEGERCRTPCKSCRHRRDADLQALVDAGRGDVPLARLRFRCSNCSSQLTDFVVTSRDEPRPW